MPEDGTETFPNFIYSKKNCGLQKNRINLWQIHNEVLENMAPV